MIDPDSSLLPSLRTDAREAAMFLTCRQLAEKWNLPESWIREQVRRRAEDPLPHVRFGKYIRFRWGSPELESWAERRIVGGNNTDNGRLRQRKETD